MISYPWTRDRGHLVAVTVQEKEHRLKYFDLGVEMLPVFTSFLVGSMVRLLEAPGFTNRQFLILVYSSVVIYWRDMIRKWRTIFHVLILA